MTKAQNTLSRIQSQGDAYVYYKKVVGKGSTYLVGTVDFDNKYILAKALEAGSGLDTPLEGNVLARLTMASNAALTEGKILVFSWTNNKFRFIEADRVTRVTGLSTELRRAGNKR